MSSLNDLNPDIVVKMRVVHSYCQFFVVVCQKIPYTNNYERKSALSILKNEILLKCVHYVNTHTVRKLDDRSYMSETVKEYLKDELIKR
jgi:hypothetical protein